MTHPTKQILIDTAVKLLDELPMDRVTSDLVLERSHISKGSLYHHFPDFGHLIDEAQAIRFARSVDLSIGSMAQMLTSATTPTQVLENINGLTRYTQSPGRSEARRDRVHLLGLATGRPYLQELLSAEQSRLNAAIADIVREAQERGLVRDNVDPLAIALLIQGYSLGLWLDDISAERVDPQAWIDLIDRLIATLIVSAPEPNPDSAGSN